jgi:hypothetical protein
MPNPLCLPSGLNGFGFEFRRRQGQTIAARQRCGLVHDHGAEASRGGSPERDVILPDVTTHAGC